MSVMHPLLLSMLLSFTLSYAHAQTGQFELSLSAQGLGGEIDAANISSSSAPLADEARTGGSDSLIKSGFRMGGRDHSTFTKGYASATELKLQSFSEASAYADVGFGTYGTGTMITSGRVSARVPFRVDSPTLYGQAGFLRVPIDISGTIGLTPGVHNLNFPGSTSGEAEVSFSIGSKIISQRIVDSGGVITLTGEPIAGTLMVDLPFNFGQWTHYDMQLSTRAGAAANAIAGSLAPSRAEVNFTANSEFSGIEVKWGGIGIAGVLDAQLEPITVPWSIESLPGLNLVSAVPMPANSYLMLIGLFTASWFIRKRRGAVNPG